MTDVTEADAIHEPAFMAARDPHVLFEDWLAVASETEPNDPNAVQVATIGEDGMPNLRTVLLKGHDERGFVFYTNFEGQKGREIAAHPAVAMNFHWKTRQRQVRVRGRVERVSDEEADAYYASRALGSRIGAWASQQSMPVTSRRDLMNAVREMERQHGDNPLRPPHWGGFRVIPVEIEFWQDGKYRLHDRLRFKRETPDAPWRTERLQP